MRRSLQRALHIGALATAVLPAPSHGASASDSPVTAPATPAVPDRPPAPPPPSANPDLSSQVLLTGVTGLLGLGLGAWLALAVGPTLRRRQPRLLSPGLGGQPSASPQRIHTLDSALPSELERVARDHAALGPVLLLPAPADRPALDRALAGVAHVRWLPALTPSATDIVRAARALQAAGPVTLIIDPRGLHADVAVDSLIDALPADVQVSLSPAAAHSSM